MKKVLTYIAAFAVVILLMISLGITVYNHKNSVVRQQQKLESVKHFSQITEITGSQAADRFQIPNVGADERGELYYVSKSALGRINDGMSIYELFKELGAASSQKRGAPNIKDYYTYSGFAVVRFGLSEAGDVEGIRIDIDEERASETSK